MTWQDGAPFTADDVKYTYDRIQDPKVDDAPLRSYFSTIKSCEVLDPYTVRFIAAEPYFKTLEVLGSMTIVPKHVLEHVADFNNAPFNRASHRHRAVQVRALGHRLADRAGAQRPLLGPRRTITSTASSIGSSRKPTSPRNF